MAETDIAIIGGGIAGLALALGLHARGIGATVYESAPEIQELGVGITILPHAMRELTALGIGEDVRLGGVENWHSAFFNRFGQKLYSEPRGVGAGYPFAEAGIHRGRLHGLLLAAVIDRLGAGAIKTDHRCVAIDQDASGVSIVFQSTATGELRPAGRAALVLSCDGVNSAVRKHFYPDDGLAFTGINTWRGVTRRKPILDGHTYMRIGSIRTGKIVIYPIIDDIDGSGDQLINWAVEIEDGRRAMNDWNTPGIVDDFMPIFESFRFDWLDVPDMIRKAHTILEYPMVDKEPIERWTFDRVTLVGDAAHPMYPRGSNGSAQALIDARVLADLLAQSDDRRGALKAYEAERLPVANNIVRTNRTSPPDVINLKVEELVGDRPFEDLDSYISQDELRALSDRYKSIAGFSAQGMAQG